jgi:hypothetical protein
VVSPGALSFVGCLLTGASTRATVTRALALIGVLIAAASARTTFGSKRTLLGATRRGACWCSIRVPSGPEPNARQQTRLVTPGSQVTKDLTDVAAGAVADFVTGAARSLLPASVSGGNAKKRGDR